jgi:uncharacterized protein (DUF1697 family)
MSKYAALLRGINVGGRMIKMADLKICFEKAGYKEVKTLLNSGNVVFVSDKNTNTLKKEIEETLTKTFNYPAKVQIVELSILKKIIDEYPFGVAGESRHDYVIFMENGLESDLINEQFEASDGEKVQAGGGVVYWRVDKGSTLKSDFAKILTKSKYKQFNTNRNLKTLKKIIV